MVVKVVQGLWSELRIGEHGRSASDKQEHYSVYPEGHRWKELRSVPRPKSSSGCVNKRKTRIQVA